MQEQRRAPRRKVLLEGRIVFNNRLSRVACTIRDLSTLGARVAVQHPNPLPPDVELNIFKTGERLQARVVRSDGETHGLMFTRVLEQGTRPLQAITQPPATGSIQALAHEARQWVAQQAGVSPDQVRLTLEIDP